MLLSVRTAAPGGAREAADLAAAAEAAGFDQIWFGNDLFGTSGVTAVAAAAVVTSRIHLGVGVFEPVSMHPVQIAMLAVGLQDLSDGRLLLGIGAGGLGQLEAAGLSRPSPVRVTREAIVAVRELLTGTAHGHQAKLHRTPDVVPPIYLGAMGPQMLAMAGEVADGALPLCLPPMRFLEVRRTVADGATAVGRDPATLDVPACVWCAVDDDGVIARRHLARQIAPYAGSLPPAVLTGEGFDPDEFGHVAHVLRDGGLDAATAAVTPDMLRLGLAGGPGDIVQMCGDLQRAGATHISFGPPLGASPLAAIETLGAQVLPRLAPTPEPHVLRATAVDAASTIRRMFHPSGVRLGIVTEASLSSVVPSMREVIRSRGLDPDRRLAVLRESTNSAGVVDFLERYGHEYSVCVLSQPLADHPDVSAAATSVGTSLIAIEAVHDD